MQGEHMIYNRKVIPVMSELEKKVNRPGFSGDCFS